ncbi:squalene synthase HpnC [Allobranchiibius sp. GilTou73]|uniref:squalene synthase HpnC n=1 Tax=Allobranchiibius sp. GilTou73 TaxID=2904523 RepID=UPI001F1DC70C|nr:squalene synthase HpnC [Allobranchiibius sp. GilTou73]UIJ34782.1 squalene synthase HpnC [Allobranchiibius sp. GilTou73]
MTVAQPSNDTTSRLPMYDARDRSENFPVALRVLPAAIRDHLRRVYSVARHIDELGDSGTGDRTAALRAYRSQVHALWAGERLSEPTLMRLAPTVTACGLSEKPFQDLVAANLQDQSVTEYADFAALLEYCALSADPVGRLVLEIFARSSPERIALSDRICSALQLLEHCQDVVEDSRAGRVYLPQDDLGRAGLSTATLLDPGRREDLCAVVSLQVLRARQLLDAGPPLLRRLDGWAKVSVAGFVAGGLATADAIERARGDVVTAVPRPRRVDVLRHIAALLLRSGGAR